MHIQEKNRLIKLLVQYIEQGYSEEQLREWLKQQKINFFTARSLLSSAAKQFKEQETKRLIETRKQQAVMHPDIKIKTELAQYEQELVQYHPYKYKKRMSRGYWQQRNLDKRYPHKVVGARIDLNNGKTRSFLVKEDRGGFIYDEGLYLFDNVSKKEDVDSGHYWYYFHEKYALPVEMRITLNNKKVVQAHLPVDIDIPIASLKADLESVGAGLDISSNPKILKKTVDGEFIKQVMQGAELDEFFRFSKTALVILLILNALILIIFVFTSGILDKIPGVGK